MPEIASPSLLLTGIVLLVLGTLLIRWANRNSLLEKTKDVVWDAVKARDTGGVRQHIEGTIGEVTGAAGTRARATKVAGMAAREAFARLVAILGWLTLLSGLALAAVGVFWR